MIYEDHLLKEDVQTRLQCLVCLYYISGGGPTVTEEAVTLQRTLIILQTTMLS